jgi:oxygen-independent coproporphyrinogen-3 oxidase
MRSNPFGLYVHIPFCAKICHYCDFAKTANFSHDHVTSYMDALVRQLKAWSYVIPKQEKFTSVFFGGGTPGLLTTELAPLMNLIQEMTVSDAEITIEANPANVTAENLKIWRMLGMNRISIGVQSFDDVGLKSLTRDHSSAEAQKALELASKSFPKSNGDLIYGWSGQTMASWRRDLEMMIDSGVNHMSLYALTYEGQTPFARAERRGVMEATSGDDVASLYDVACEVLRDRGFDHEEISNWSRPGQTCKHNWLYWLGDKYVGIGAGAHGFVDDRSAMGLRYHYDGDLRRFLRSTADVDVVGDVTSVIEKTGGVVDRDRDLQSWLLEYIGCGLRSKQGVSLELLNSKGFSFKPSPVLQRALADGLIYVGNESIKLSESEWFRETAWSLEVCDSMLFLAAKVAMKT